MVEIALSLTIKNEERRLFITIKIMHRPTKNMKFINTLKITIMKKLLSVFATLMMVLFATGCSNNDDMVVASQDAQTTVTRAVSDKIQN